jgi:UDP-N-acetylmuramyl tripeptide synthase
MRWIDSRRITGPHLLVPGPGAAVEVALSDDETTDGAVAVVRSRLETVHRALGWGPVGEALRLGVRPWDPRPADAPLAPGQVAGAGVSLACRAPPDQLETACLALEMAVDGAVDLDALAASASAEANPALRRCVASADARGWAWMVDEDGFTLGTGRFARTWALDALPDTLAAPEGRVPIALVTGTNGKTTTSRLIARMVRAAGLVDGLTSSDAIAVGGTVVDRGDWSGPGAARRVLRDPSVAVAVLETARGGLLRRGMALADADVAVVTNISDDHFGEYGVSTLDGMAEAKLSIAAGLRIGATLAVNARSAPLRAALPALRAQRPDLRVVSFEDDDGDGIVLGGTRVSWDEIPVTFGGRARHNVENVLAALTVARVLGVPDAAIAEALRSFRPDLADSAGRMNLIERDGVRILVDFAHNPDGIRRLAPVVAGLGAGRRLLVIGQAGDRTDALLAAFAEAAAELRCARYVVKEMESYARGRAPGEVPERLEAGLRAAGVSPEAIVRADDDVDAARQALAWAQPGDVLVLLIHADLDGVRALLDRDARDVAP